MAQVTFYEGEGFRGRNFTTDTVLADTVFNGKSTNLPGDITVRRSTEMLMTLSKK